MSDSDARPQGTGHGIQWDKLLSTLAIAIAAASLLFTGYQYYDGQKKDVLGETYAGAILGMVYVEIDERLHQDKSLATNPTKATSFLRDELRRYAPTFVAAHVPIDPQAYVAADMDSDLRPPTAPNDDYLANIIANTLEQISTDGVGVSSFNYSIDIAYLRKAESLPNFSAVYQSYSGPIAKEATASCPPLPDITDRAQQIQEVEKRATCFGVK